MGNGLSEINKKRRIVKLTEEFMCAMLSNGKWWDAHTDDTEKIVRKARAFAVRFYSTMEGDK